MDPVRANEQCVGREQMICNDKPLPAIDNVHTL